MTGVLTGGRRSGIVGIVTATLLGAALCGCFGNETTVFPDGLEPLEEVTVAAPEGLPDDPYPEQLNLVTGETARYDLVLARGYVQAPLADVFVAMTTPEVCVDRRAVDMFTITLDVEEGYDHSFRVRNVVEDIVTVEFDTTWRHSLIEGDQESPELVAGAWQKTWGTVFISLLRGSIVARPVDDATTEVEMVMHLDGDQGGVDPAVSFVTDYHSSIVAAVHGEPLPTY